MPITHEQAGIAFSHFNALFGEVGVPVKRPAPIIRREVVHWPMLEKTRRVHAQLSRTSYGELRFELHTYPDAALADIFSVHIYVESDDLQEFFRELKADLVYAEDDIDGAIRDTVQEVEKATGWRQIMTKGIAMQPDAEVMTTQHKE